MKNRLERLLAVFGAVVLLVVGIDAVSYAATGKAFLLGGTNSASKVTTIKNTGAGAVLSLQTKSTGSAPLVTNGRGLVKNFNAEMVGGMSANQLKGAALDAFSFAFTRTNAATATVNYSQGTTYPAVVSNAGAQSLAYQLSGTLTFPCNTAAANAASTSYGMYIGLLDNNNLTDVYFNNQFPTTACGKPMAIPPTMVTMTPTAKILVEGQGFGGMTPGPNYFPATLSLNLTGKLLKANL